LIQIVFINMLQVGQSFGFIVTPPLSPPPYPSYVAFLFPAMIAIALISVLASWFLLRSRFGIGLFSIKDDELAAESVGVPTFKLKLLAATMSGLFMGLADTTDSPWLKRRTGRALSAESLRAPSANFATSYPARMMKKSVNSQSRSRNRCGR